MRLSEHDKRKAKMETRASIMLPMKYYLMLLLAHFAAHNMVLHFMEKPHFGDFLQKYISGSD